MKQDFNQITCRARISRAVGTGKDLAGARGGRFVPPPPRPHVRPVSLKTPDRAPGLPPAIEGKR